MLKVYIVSVDVADNYIHVNSNSELVNANTTALGSKIIDLVANENDFSLNPVSSNFNREIFKKLAFQTLTLNDFVEKFNCNRLNIDDTKHYIYLEI